MRSQKSTKKCRLEIFIKIEGGAGKNWEDPGKKWELSDNFECLEYKIDK